MIGEVPRDTLDEVLGGRGSQAGRAMELVVSDAWEWAGARGDQ